MLSKAQYLKLVTATLHIIRSPSLELDVFTLITRCPQVKRKTFLKLKASIRSRFYSVAMVGLKKGLKESSNYFVI